MCSLIDSSLALLFSSSSSVAFIVCKSFGVCPTTHNNMRSNSRRSSSVVENEQKREGRSCSKREGKIRINNEKQCTEYFPTEYQSILG